MSGSFEERRLARSHDPLVALFRLLESARARARLEAVVVSDETGCLVAAAGPSRLCEELSAHAPLEPANDVVPTRLDVLARRSEVRRLSIDGVVVLLSGQGDSHGLGAGLEHAAAGCQRILGGR
jgi:hypothetical protein